MGVLEGADAFDALFTAESGLLHPAERGAQVEARGAVVVDPDVAADQLRADALGGIRAVGPDRSAEPAPGVVRQRDGLFFGVEGDDRDDGPELLLGDDAEVRVGVDDDRGADEVAAGEVAAGEFAVFTDVGAGILGFLDDLVDERLLR